MIYSALDIADYILWFAAQKGVKLSHMQLQKHLYYAQGYSLGMTGEKLFNEPIHAWEHGPVVQEVFQRFRRYGANIITPPDYIEIPPDISGIIDVVVSAKGSMSASALRNATHSEPPYSTTPRNKEITAQSLEIFFTDKFWTSDEEDEYEPAFDTEEEELNFLKDSIPEEKKRLMIDARSK